jgi:DNA-binding response OmpR family regulator
MIATREWLMDKTRRRILFIDNDQDTCDMMRILLGQAGYEATAVKTLAEGLTLAKSSNFDMILLDWFFEDGTGIDLCKMIREFDGQTPIFFYTGMAGESSAKEMLRAGAQGCFIKPVEVDSLLQTMETYVGDKNGRDITH